MGESLVKDGSERVLIVGGVTAEIKDGFGERTELNSGLLFVLSSCFPQACSSTLVTSVDEIVCAAQVVRLVEERFDGSQSQAVGDGLAEQNRTKQSLESSKV